MRETTGEERDQGRETRGTRGIAREFAERGDSFFPSSGINDKESKGEGEGDVVAAAKGAASSLFRYPA